MSENRLIEIPLCKWPELRDMYKIDWPTYFLPFYTIQNYINWFEKDPDVKQIKTYSLNGFFDDGTYIIMDNDNILFCTLNKNLDNLVTALNLLDKSISYNLHGYIDKMLPAVKKLFEINKWNFYTEYHETILFYKKKEEVSNFKIEIPDNIILRPLSQNDAETVNEIFPYCSESALIIIKHLIEYNANIGAYNKDTGELMGWVFHREYGSIGILQVKDSYKRLGLGTLLIKVISKMLMDKGIDATAPVIIRNTASRNLFKRLGFQETCNVFWNLTESNIPNSDDI